MKIKYFNLIFWIGSLFYCFMIISYYKTTQDFLLDNILSLDFKSYLFFKYSNNLEWTFFNDNDHYDYLNNIEGFFENIIDPNSILNNLLRNDITISYIIYLLSPSFENRLVVILIFNFTTLLILYYLNYKLLTLFNIKKNFLSVVLPILIFSYYVPQINKELFTILFLFTSIFFLKKPSLKIFLVLIFISLFRIQFALALAPMLFFIFCRNLKMFYIILFTFIYFTICLYFLSSNGLVSYNNLYFAILFDPEKDYFNIILFYFFNILKVIFTFFNFQLIYEKISDKIFANILYLIIFFHVLLIIFVNFKYLIKKSLYLNSDKRILLYIIFLFFCIVSISGVTSQRYVFNIYPLLLLYFNNSKNYY